MYEPRFSTTPETLPGEQAGHVHPHRSLPVQVPSATMAGRLRAREALHPAWGSKVSWDTGQGSALRGWLHISRRGGAGVGTRSQILNTNDTTAC